MMLSILSPSGAEILKEIITIVEVSEQGARFRGRRTLQPEWKGNIVQLSSGRQAPVRIVWQVKAADQPEFWETGIEILADYNFWDRPFSNPDAEPELAIDNAALPVEEFLKALRQGPAAQSQHNNKLLETLWCGLVEQLEELKVLTRQDLVAAIRRIGEGRNSSE